MKIIVAGDGKLGSSVTRQLSLEGNDLTVIDLKESVLESSEGRYDVMSIQGNCAAMDVLNQAGAKTADLLITVTNSDEVNLLSCLTAFGMNPHIHTIARIRNPEYQEQIYRMRDIFALSMTVDPDRQTAVEMERLLKYPGFLQREPFAHGRVELVELKIEKGSRLCDVAMKDLHRTVNCNVLICTVVRNGSAISPDGNFVLKEGDRVFITAAINELSTLLKNLNIITHKVRAVLICGGSRFAVYLTKLLQRSGIEVKIIEKDHDRCEYLAEILPKAEIICGDASKDFLLEGEDISRYDAVISATGLDELNMIISMYALHCGVPQVLTKLGRGMEVNGSIISSMNLGSTIAPKDLCCNSIVQYVRAMKNQTGAALAVYSIAGGQAEAVEFRIDDTCLHCGEPLKKIKTRKNVLVACLSRGSYTEIPNGDTYFQVGDTVVIVVSGGGVISNFNEIFV